MAWMVGAAALVALLLIPACGAVSRDKPAPAADSGADASDDASEEQDPHVDPELCRVQGYGLGPLGMGPCDATHLFSHSADACASSGGVTTGQYEISEACETALEVRVTCCYADALPAVESLSPPRIGGTFTLLLASPGAGTRDQLLVAANDSCADEEQGAQLSDWIVYYAPDGVTPLGLRYTCFNPGP